MCACPWALSAQEQGPRVPNTDRSRTVVAPPETSWKLEEHAKNMGGNKAAGSRARKAIGEVKKLVTDYRKASVAGE